MSAREGHHERPRVRAFGDIARQLLQRKRAAEAARHGDLRRAWEHVVGEEVARQTSVRSFTGGSLTIDVGTPTLLHELNNFMRADLLAALRADSAARDVACIRFCLRRELPEETA